MKFPKFSAQMHFSHAKSAVRRHFLDLVKPMGTKESELGVKMILRIVVLGLSLVVTQNVAYGKEGVSIKAGFESGQIQPKTERVDGFWVTTLPENQSGSASIRTGAGGGDANSGWDLRVVKSETVGGQLVKPRNGRYFARFLIDKSKNYKELNDGLNKPRNQLHALADRTAFDFDTEVWLGVSIFVPVGHEDETLNDARGGITLVGTNTDSSATFFSLRIQTSTNDNKSHWVIRSHTDDSSVEDSVESKTFTDLGSVRPDIGKWTDFVFRVRANPFTVDTNPAKKKIPNSKNRLYLANRGILQVWKSVGQVDSSGNRNMKLKMNILNSPVGLVPGTTNGKSLFSTSLRTYKAQWQTHNSSVKGPIWLGFDEYRAGQAIRDGVGYSDVHPAGRACTDQCPNNQSGGKNAPPKGPRELVISEVLGEPRQFQEPSVILLSTVN